MPPQSPPNPGSTVGPTPQPQPTSQYDFIMQASDQPPQPPAPKGGLLKKRILAIVGGLVIVSIIAIAASTIFGGKDSSTTELADIMARQQEIARISETALKTTKDQNTKNLAATVKASLTSQQKELNDYLKKIDVKFEPAQLSSHKSSATDQLLSSAAQNGQFESEYITYLNKQLTEYKSAIKTTYPKVKQATKALLDKAYESAEAILASPQFKST
jgi:hypothetical protein